MAQQNSPEMQQAQADMEAAYAQMSPEERAMMESMGLSGLMGAGAAAAQSGSGRPPQAPAASAPTGSSMSLAKALKGDNNTQTVQNYLQALGYDTGDANGEMSLDTTIAISQFQAEYGMDATGEITPQLIGILAAKVDAL
jgi:localization factor PodJL